MSSNNTKTDLSPNQRAWKRLKKNKPAVFGMFVIAFSIVVAILGYLITPDQTPSADDQVVEVAMKPPFFTVQMLKVRKNRNYQEVGLLGTMLSGKPSAYTLVPINAYTINEDKIDVEVYRGHTSKGELLKGKPMSYNLADVLYPLKGKANFADGIVNYETIDGKKHTANADDLSSEINKNSIFNKTYYLGTDKFGRSSLSRLMIGVRVSLIVGLIAVFISLTLGVFMGAVSGYFGGRIDDFIMLIINTMWSIPTLLLVFAIVLAFGRSIQVIFLAVGLTMWVDVARIVRGQILSLKTIQFVEAAQSMGFGHARIIWKHILPNTLGPVMVVAAANFAAAILIESGLSYLGFGIQPPNPSWGTMIKENYVEMFGNNPSAAFIPCLAVMIMVLAFNLVGNGLRDALDVQSK